MYKMLTLPNIDKICDQVNEEGLEIVKIEQVRGHLKALCKKGDKNSSKSFVKKLQGPNQHTLIDFINTREGEIEHMVVLAGGATVLVARFDKNKFEKLGKAEEERIAKEEEERIAKERAEKANEIKQEIKILEEQKKELEKEKEK